MDKEPYLDDSDPSNLYSDALLARYDTPLYKRTVYSPTFSAEGSNPFCGDSLRIEGTLDENGLMRALGFSGYGCAISEVVCDLLLEYAEGRATEEIADLDEGFMEGLLGFKVPYSRKRCLMLPLEALKTALPK
jgi:nitrogen fixation NifU-like protein